MGSKGWEPSSADVGVFTNHQSWDGVTLRTLHLCAKTNTKQQTTNTKHQTTNNKHQTPNTKHQTPNAKRQTPNTKPQTTNHKHQTININVKIPHRRFRKYWK